MIKKKIESQKQDTLYFYKNYNQHKYRNFIFQISKIIERLLKIKISFKYVIAAFVFAYFLIITRSIFIPATNEESRHFIRGDGFSDQNVYSTVLWVKDFGFWESKLRAVLFYKGDLNKSTVQVYTHYPSYPDMLIAAYGFVLKTTNESILRTLPILMSLILVFLVYKVLFFFPLSKSERNLNMILFLLSGYFIFWADNLHKHLHEYLAIWASIYLLWHYYLTPQIKNSNKRYIFFWFLPVGFIATQASFETYVIIATLVIGTSLAFEKGYRKLISPLNIFLGILFLIGLFFHLYLNKLYFGSWELTLADMKASYLQRIGAGLEHEKMTLLKYLDLPFRFINRQERYFFIPGFAQFIFLFIYLKQLKSTNIAAFKMLIVMCFASISWYIFMSQHAYMHHFTAKHFGIVSVIISAPGIKWSINKLMDAFNHPEKDKLPNFRMFFYFILNLYIILMCITQIVFPVWWQHSLKFLFNSI